MLSIELFSKECENIVELEFGMGCLLNPTLIFTEQLLQSTGPNSTAPVYVSKAKIGGNS